MAISSRQCPQGYTMVNGVCNKFGDVSSPCMGQCANLHPSNCGYSSFNDSCLKIKLAAQFESSSTK